MRFAGEGPARSHLSDGVGFTQFSKRYLGLLEDLIMVSPAAAKLWVWFVRRANRMNAVYATAEAVMAESGLPRRTYYRAIGLLEQHKWVRQDGAAFHLNAKLVWSGDARKIGAAQLLEPVTGFAPQEKLPEEIPVKIAKRSAA